MCVCVCVCVCVCCKLLFPDSVCIEAMSINISRKTLDKGQANLDSLVQHIRE